VSLGLIECLAPVGQKPGNEGMFLSHPRLMTLPKVLMATPLGSMHASNQTLAGESGAGKSPRQLLLGQINSPSNCDLRYKRILLCAIESNILRRRWIISNSSRLENKPSF
jgi:hypothetical protein